LPETVYLNGSFVPYDQALVSVEDRGMLFADGVYEVIRAYGGHLFEPEAHLERLAASAAEVRLPLPPLDDLRAAISGVMALSGLPDCSVYIQVTRGAAGPRAHALPAAVRPTVFVAARPVPRPDPTHVRDGAAAITVPDRRWHMCHVKSIGLLLNTLAKQAAVDAGAQEAIFVRDGVVTEGSATNCFAVFDGVVATHPEGPHILAGITRQVLLDICRSEGIPCREEPFLVSRLYGADEAFVTGTNSEVLPVTTLDGRPIGSGRPGPVTQRLQASFSRRTGSAAAVAAAPARG
jgi:D-alanine transaminase